MTIAERINNLDTGLLDYIESQTSIEDRKSLLALHDGVAATLGQFSYLEIGSHLGGTLQAVLADPRCKRVVSIDPRPQWQPDDRPDLDGWTYEGNSTERMISLLADVQDVDLSKLETVEASSEDLSPDDFAAPDFCFIDGEHTYRAALRDARFCRAVSQGRGVIAFHDFNIIPRAPLDFLRETGRPHRAYSLASCVFVVELGLVPTLLDRPGVRAQLRRPSSAWIAGNRLKGDALVTWLDISARELRKAFWPGRDAAEGGSLSSAPRRANENAEPMS